MNTIEFLKSWCGDTGPFSVGAIDPDDSEGHAWLTTRDPAEVESFVEHHGALKRNLYYQVGVVRPDLGNRRARRENMAVATAVQVEVDPPKEIASAEELEAWQVEVGQKYIDPSYWDSLGLPQPTLLLFSGSGYQLAWRLEQPVVLWRGQPLAQDPALVDAVESRNRALVERLRGDPASTDVSRLLRLPGTLNWPGESKRAKGRTEAVLAEIVDYNPARRVPLGRLPAAAPAARTGTSAEIPEFEGAPDDDALLRAAEVLGNAWAAKGERHSAHLALAGALARAGWPEELIADFAAAVAEVAQPGNGMYDKRLTAARSSVAKVRAGEAISGWPTLLQYVPEEAVAEARKLLGFADPVEDDPEFAAALVEADPSPPPPDVTRVDLSAVLRKMERRWSRSTKIDLLHDGEMLKRIRQGALTTRADEDRDQFTGKALRALLRAAPEAPTELLVEHFAPARLDISTSDLAGIIDRMRTVVREEVRSKRPPSEFVLEPSGPREGMPVSKSEHNIRVALRKLNVEFKYNAFSDQKIISRSGVEEIVQDHHIKILRNTMEREFAFCPEKDYLFDTCEVIARESAFHPILDYLDGLPSVVPVEDRELPETWLIRFAGAEDTPYVRAVSRLMLVAAVRRVRQPGCLFQEMLILETPVQGKGKSEGLRALVPNTEWFSDDFSLHVDDSRRMMEQTDGKWIIESPELKGFLRADADAVKQYLSRRADRARMAYGRETRHKLREFVIFGTINDLEYFKDPTGNRRFWPVRVQQFDKEGLIAVRDRLWAAASILEQEHPEEEYLRLDPSLYEAAAAEQEKRRLVSPTEDRLREVFDDSVTGAIMINEVYKILGYEEKPPTRGQKQEIVSALQTLGFTKERAAIGGKQREYYMRGETDALRRIRLHVTGSAVTGWALRQETHASERGVDKAPQPAEIRSN